MSRSALLSLPLCAACSFGLSEPEKDGGPIVVGNDTALDGDTDTGADDTGGETGADTDSGGDTDSGDTTEGEWACGPYAPHVQAGRPYPQVSSRATYTVNDPAHGTGTSTYDVLGESTQDGVDGWMNLETGDTTDSSGYAHHWEITTFVLCDTTGLRMHSQVSLFERATESGTVTDRSVRTFEPPALVMPRTMAVGSTWTYDTTITETHDSGDVITRVLSKDRVVTEESSHTVAAGTYTALRIVETDDAGATADLWMAPLVGAVTTPTAELVSFERFD